MNKVVILTDASGHFYIIGQDTLDQNRVRAKEHIEVVEELLKKSAGDKPHLTIAGTYAVADDRFLDAIRLLRPDYVMMPSQPMPA